MYATYDPTAAIVADLISTAAQQADFKRWCEDEGHAMSRPTNYTTSYDMWAVLEDIESHDVDLALCAEFGL